MDPDENDQQDQNDQNNDADGTEGKPPADGDTGPTDGRVKPGDSGTDQPDPDVEKWKRLSRKNEKELRAVQAKLKEYEDATKSESQRLEEDRDSHRSRAEKAEGALKRREIAEQAAPEHATLAQIKAVAKRLHGGNDDELEADAKELFELVAPAPRAEPKTQMPAKPRERLRGGGDPDDEPEELDPRKLAARIPRAR